MHRVLLPMDKERTVVINRQNSQQLRHFEIYEALERKQCFAPSCDDIKEQAQIAQDQKKKGFSSVCATQECAGAASNKIRAKVYYTTSEQKARPVNLS